VVSLLITVVIGNGVKLIMVYPRDPYWVLYSSCYTRYIKDLPKIVQCSSKPTLFAGDTILIFSNPNYLDLKPL